MMDNIITVGAVAFVILWLVYIMIDNGPPGSGGGNSSSDDFIFPVVVST